MEWRERREMVEGMDLIKGISIKLKS